MVLLRLPDGCTEPDGSTDGPVKGMLPNLLNCSWRATGCEPSAYLNADLPSDALCPFGALGPEDDGFIVSDIGYCDRIQRQTADGEAAHLHFRKGATARISIQHRNAGECRHKKGKKAVFAADF